MAEVEAQIDARMIRPVNLAEHPKTLAGIDRSHAPDENADFEFRLLLDHAAQQRADRF
ncbi:hypothetical protein D3C86_2016790 [compost metagenome]